MGRSKQVVFLFEDEGNLSVTARGGKGYGLSELTGLGVPVPPGFTITTSVARAFSQHGRLPGRLNKQIERQIHNLEKSTGKRFASADNPLLVSVRSGAAVSMPGMMDTILNLGLNPEIVDGLAKQHGVRFAYDCYRRFLSMFGEVVLGIHRSAFEDALFMHMKMTGIEKESKLAAETLPALCRHYLRIIESRTGSAVPENPWVQLQMAITAVFGSWNNSRARAYREANRVSNGLGTAVNIQSMVYGNMDNDSGTGVVFSRDVAVGDNRLYGEFLINAQGEDVVDGSHAPMPIAAMSTWNAQILKQLLDITKRLEIHCNDVVDIEFTVQSGQLHILQVRNAKRTPEAAATIATHFVWEKRWTKQEALSQISARQLQALSEAGISQELIAHAEASGKVMARGLAASPGVAAGRVVFNSDQAVAMTKLGERVILVRPDTSVDDLKGMHAASAIVTAKGGTTSHAAVVARSLGKPAVVGCGEFTFQQGQVISVDGRAGIVIEGKLERTGGLDKKEINLLLKWAKTANFCASPSLRFELISQHVSSSLLINDFYLAEAMADAAKGSQLGHEAAKYRAAVHREVADKLAMYLVVAAIDESWYCFGPNHHAALRAECPTALDILKQEFRAESKPLETLKELPDEKRILFLDLLATVYKAKAWGPDGDCRFGGKSWAMITSAAASYLRGHLTATLFADYAFDLEHNGGTVFGKHPMIVMECRRRLHKQLDAKKNAQPVNSLYLQLMRLDPRLSGKTKTLFTKGVALGIWEDLTGVSSEADSA